MLEMCSQLKEGYIVYDKDLGKGIVTLAYPEFIKVRFYKERTPSSEESGWQYSTRRSGCGDTFIARLIYDSNGCYTGRTMKYQTLYLEPPHECNGLIVCKECMKDAVDF